MHKYVVLDLQRIITAQYVDFSISSYCLGILLYDLNNKTALPFKTTLKNT